MILKRGASFQYLKVSMLSFKNIGGGLFCCCFGLVFGFVGLVGFFNKHVKIMFILCAGSAYTEL